MVDIRQEINITNVTADPVDGVAVFYGGSGLAEINASDYNGATGYFEIVAKNSDRSARSVTISSNDNPGLGGGSVISISVPANTNAWELIRSSDFTLAADPYYMYYVSGTYDTVISIRSAKIIILQSDTNITDTVTQIEVGQFATFIPASTNTDYPITEPKYWKYESAKWDPTPTFTFGFTLGIEDDKETYKIGLQEASDAAFTSNVLTITASQVTVNVEVVGYYESSAFTPTDGYFYRVVYQGDDNKDDIYLYNAKIIATQGTIDVSTGSALDYYLWGGILEGVYQSFETLQDQTLNKATFQLSKSGAPTGNIYAKLYAHTGTFGTSSEPTGSALATSDAVDVSSLTTSPVDIEFTFSTPYELLDSTQYYCIGIEFDGGDSGNFLLVRYDTGAHAGNKSQTADIGSPSYTPNSATDLFFRATAEVTKLQPEYLMINDAQTGTGNQKFLTDWDPAEWDGVSNTYWHEHSADSASSNTKLQEIISYHSSATGGTFLRSTSRVEISQSFTGIDSQLLAAKVNLKLYGSPTGNAYAKLYAHSGTFGTSSVPTEAALATSDAFDVSTLTTDYAAILFNFSTPYTLSDGAKYCITIQYSGGDSTNYIIINYDSAGTHEGNLAAYISSWIADASEDFMFDLYFDIENSDITGDDLTRGGTALTMPSTAKEIDSYIVTA